MRVILQENVTNLGKVAEQVVVKPGFARNFLIPTGKCIPATKANVEAVMARRDELEAKAQALLASAQQRAESLKDVVLTISANASEEGRLFGSVMPQDIAAALVEQDISVKKNEVLLSDGPLRQVGEYTVTLHLHPEVDAEVKVDVVAEK